MYRTEHGALRGIHRLPKPLIQCQEKDSWSVLKRFGCTDKIINLVRAFHDGMKAKIVQGKDTSKEFEVTNGVKQGCVLAPTLFSLPIEPFISVGRSALKEAFSLVQ